MDQIQEFRERLQDVEGRMVLAAEKSGRAPEAVTLIPVTKTVSAERLRLAQLAGIRRAGENRAQEILDKQPQLPDLEWHFIGQLQTNKVKYIIDKVVMIQSVDRMSLAKEIHRQAEAKQIRIPVLIQVNIGHEPQKGGAAPEELTALLEQAALLPGLRVCGLMAVPPHVEDPELARPYFAEMKHLFERAAEMKIPGVEMQVLSMGMTGDFQVAIEEGATMVRVGTAIFGKR